MGSEYGQANPSKQEDRPDTVVVSSNNSRTSQLDKFKFLYTNLDGLSNKVDLLSDIIGKKKNTYNYDY